MHLGSVPSAGEEPPLVLVLGPDAERLRSILETLATAPRVRPLSDLYGDAASILNQPPASLWIDVEPLTDEDLGALRLLRTLLPTATLVFTANPAHTEAGTRLAAALGGRLVRRPFRTAEVLAAHTGQQLQSTQANQDLIQGVADEIGNPLLFASGYLQLLSISIDRSADPETAEKLDLVRMGIDRIGRSVEKLRILSGTLKPVVSRRDPLPLITASLERARPRAALRQVEIPPPAPAPEPQIELMLDPERFSLAVDSMLKAAIEIVDRGAALAISAHAERGQFVLRVGIPATGHRDTDAGRLFDPYALAARIRGSESGLDLPLARTIMAAQGGQSKLYRAAEDVLVLEFFFPLAAPETTEAPLP